MNTNTRGENLHPCQMCLEQRLFMAGTIAVFSLLKKPKPALDEPQQIGILLPL